VIKNQRLLNPLPQKATSLIDYQGANNLKLKAWPQSKIKEVKAADIHDHSWEIRQKRTD